MKKFLLSMFVLLLIGGVNVAHATKKYADLSKVSNVLGNATWDNSEKKLSWTASSNNLMDLPDLVGDWSAYSTIKLETSDLEGGGQFRLMVYFDGDPVTITMYSAGSKDLNFSERFQGKDLSKVTQVRIGGSGSNSGSVIISKVYLDGKPMSLDFDENGVATIDKTDLIGSGYISYDDETGVVTSHYGEDGAASYGSLKVNLPSGGIDISNCDGFKVNYTGTAVIGTIEFKNAVGNWTQQFGNNPLGRDGVASYLENATSLNTMSWFGNGTAGTMTISSVELHGNVITASNPHYTNLTKDMFHKWKNADANAEQTDETQYPSYALNTALVPGETVYGDGNVYYLNYADISAFDKLVIKGTAGTKLRVLLNRLENNGTLIDLTKTFDANGIIEVDLTTYEFAHLCAIKRAYDGATATVTSLQLYKAVIDAPYDYAIAGSGVLTASALAALADASATSIDATGIVKATELTTANPNCMIVANAGMVTNANNVIVDGTSANLALTAGHPFAAPAAFTATAATYTATVSDAGVATLVLPYAATIPEGVKAYTLAYSSGDAATATLVEGTIPADTPVLLNAAAGTYTFTGTGAVAATTADPVQSGALHGVYASTTVPQGSYVLQAGSQGAGFYQVQSDDVTVNPFRAYLKATAAGARVRIVYPEEASAIELLTAGDQTTTGRAIYNLAGQRLNGLQRGINIVGGKKVLVK